MSFETVREILGQSDPKVSRRISQLLGVALLASGPTRLLPQIAAVGVSPGMGG